MITHKSTYQDSLITGNQTAYPVKCNTVVFENTGTSNITINDVYILLPGTNRTLGGRLEIEIDDSFKIDFDGDAGKLNILTETIAAL